MAAAPELIATAVALCLLAWCEMQPLISESTIVDALQQERTWGQWRSCGNGFAPPVLCVCMAPFAVDINLCNDALQEECTRAMVAAALLKVDHEMTEKQVRLFFESIFYVNRVTHCQQRRWRRCC